MIWERLENPVFRQSSRQRMRGARTYGCLLAYLLILALVVVISYQQFVQRGTWGTTTGLAQTLFNTLVFTQWFLVAVITPALTSSAITMEKEQRTFDLLAITPLSRMAIIWGKFASAMAFVVVMILCGMPLVAVLFLLGGIDVGVMLGRYGGMLVTGALLAALGLAMSAMCTTSTLANLLTYGALVTGYPVAAAAGAAYLLSHMFGGGSFTIVGIGTGLTPWQLWTFLVVGLLLVIWSLLQVAANYLLPDPRAGAWKTRLLIGLLYALVLGMTVLDMHGSLTKHTGPNMLTGIVALLLLPLLAAAVSTGVPYPGRRWYEWLYPRSIVIGAVQSAPLYLLLLILLAIAADQLMPVGTRTTPITWAYVLGYYWWLWSLGYLVSALLRNRWGAFFALVGGLLVLAQFLMVAAMRWEFLMAGLSLVVPAEPWEAKGRDFTLWVYAYPVLGLMAAGLGARVHRMKQGSMVR